MGQISCKRLHLIRHINPKIIRYKETAKEKHKKSIKSNTKTASLTQSFSSSRWVLQQALPHRWCRGSLQIQNPLPPAVTGTSIPPALLQPLTALACVAHKHAPLQVTGTVPCQRSLRWERTSQQCSDGAAPGHLLLLQVNGVRPPLYREDVGQRALVCAEEQRKEELGMATTEKQAQRAGCKS